MLASAAGPGSGSAAAPATRARCSNPTLAAGQFLRRNVLQTACPDEQWLPAMRTAAPAAAITAIIVGCNKGFEAARLVELWDPRANSSAWFDSVVAAMRNHGKVWSGCLRPSMRLSPEAQHAARRAA
eukprot:gene640-9150_t